MDEEKTITGKFVAKLCKDGSSSLKIIIPKNQVLLINGKAGDKVLVDISLYYGGN